MTHKITFPRALWALPVALGLLMLALVASPAAQAHGKSGKHGERGKSAHSHKRHQHKPAADGRTVSVAGGKTKLSVDAGTGAALGSLGIAVEPVKPARVSRRGAFRFPITGGEVNAMTLVGQIRHSGGLAFVKGATRVELTNFHINIDAQPDLTAMVGGARVSILSLDVSGLERKDRRNTIRLSGIKASLTADAAGALNAAFSTSAFTAGLPIGTARVKAYVKHDRARHDDRHGGRHGKDDDDDDRRGGRDDD